MTLDDLAKRVLLVGRMRKRAARANDRLLMRDAAEAQADLELAAMRVVQPRDRWDKAWKLAGKEKR